MCSNNKSFKISWRNAKRRYSKRRYTGFKRGISNLLKHIDNLKNKFGMQTIVAINKYNHDTEKEINFLQAKLNSNNIQMSLVESWGKGSEGAVDLAKKSSKSL